MGIQALFLQRKWQKFAILRWFIKVWGVERRTYVIKKKYKDFVNYLLLDLLMDKKFRKQK